ncbi:MAG: helix-turn-helix domain-containing protein, partial [Gemmataceae bacterium]|nr:helix-turn-helix domain-containing protein [Gemmataceae bacterium]
METTLPALLTDHDVAEWLQTSLRSVARLVKQRQIPFVTLPNGDVRFDPNDLASWVKSFR